MRLRVRAARPPGRRRGRGGRHGPDGAPAPARGGEDVPVLQALEDVAVRPTSQQTLVFLGKDFSLEHTAEEAQDLRFAGAGGSLLLKDASGRTLGAVTGIYLPTDETSVKPLDET